jgi:hypothetical protein
MFQMLHPKQILPVNSLVFQGVLHPGVTRVSLHSDHKHPMVKEEAWGWGEVQEQDGIRDQEVNIAFCNQYFLTNTK